MNKTVLVNGLVIKLKLRIYVYTMRYVKGDGDLYNFEYSGARRKPYLLYRHTELRVNFTQSTILNVFYRNYASLLITYVKSHSYRH